MWRKRTITGCPTATTDNKWKREERGKRSRLKLRFEVPQKR